MIYIYIYIYIYTYMSQLGTKVETDPMIKTG